MEDKALAISLLKSTFEQDLGILLVETISFIPELFNKVMDFSSDRA
jgi:hypothetical protein